MILYHYFRSSCSYRVRAVLEYKKIPCEYKHVHLLNQGGEQNHSNYQKMNPIGEVPALELDTKEVIAQSTAIVEYLEDLYPNPCLMPQDPLERAKVRQICQLINASIQPLQNLRVLAEVQNLNSSDDTKQNWLNHWLGRGLFALEKTLEKSNSNFFVSDSLTMAEIFFVPQWVTSQRYKIDLSSFARLQKLAEFCLEMDFFKKSHPDFWEPKE